MACKSRGWNESIDDRVLPYYPEVNGQNLLEGSKVKATAPLHGIF